MPLDHATREVFDALDQSRGKGARKQGLRTVEGLATDTDLKPHEVERVLGDHPELFMQSRLPDKHGNTLFRLRPAAVGSQAIESVETADSRNVQEVAGSSLRLSDAYYEDVLRQARQSFRSAIIAGAVGLAFFLAAVGFVLASNDNDAAVISAISGAIVQAIAGLNFWLYGRTAQQLDTFHVRLEQTQRFLIANSLCESLADEHRDGARENLISIIATYTEAKTTTSE